MTLPAISLVAVPGRRRQTIEIAHDIERRGYAVVETPLDVFQKSGGSACCLTLRLDHRSSAAQAIDAVQAVAAPAR